MNCNRFWLLALLVCQFVLADSTVAQQPPERKPAANEPVEEAPTKIYWLRDEKGKLVPLLGHTLDEILRLLDRQNQVPAAEKPLYDIRQLAATGTVNGQHAELSFEFEITVTGTDWVRVPLRLGEAVLKKSTYNGSGEHLVEFAEDGHVCWIKSKNDQPHKLTIQTLVRLSDAGGEQRLRLTAPLATKSTLRLRVPLANPVARLSDRAVLEVKRKLGNKQSELVVSGLDSSFEVGWRRDVGATARSTTVFEATTGLLVTVNGPSIRTKAHVNLAGLQGSVESLQVRLPSGAKLLPEGVETSTGEKLVFQLEGDVVDIKLPEKVDAGNTFECVLLTEQFAEQTRFNGIEGFEVLNAARQSGHVAIRVEGDWQLTFKRQGVWEFDTEKLPEPLQDEGVETGFEYFHPRWSLSVRIDRRQPRISVEPAYSFVVTQDEVQLEARLKYTVRSAAITQLELNPNGWEFDLSNVESDRPNLLDLDRVVESPNRLEFRLSQRQQGSFEIVLHGKRKLVADAGSIELVLPRPKYDSLGPASVVVQAADNIELTPKADEMVGMSRRPLEMVRLAMGGEWQQPPLVYRTSVSTARFVSEMAVHSRRVSADVTSRVHLTSDGGNVAQRLRFRIEYEPLSELLLMVPAQLDASDVKVRVGDSDAAITPVPNQSESDVNTQMRVLLPMRYIGLVDLEISFPLASQPLEPGSGVERTIPLIMPAEAHRVANRLLVTADDHLSVEPVGDDWQVDEQTLRFGSLGRGGPQRLTCAAWMTAGRLRVLREASELLRATRVDRAWIQSRIAGRHRRDRAVYQLTSTDSSIEFQLPANVQPESVRASIAGLPAEEFELQPATGDERARLTLELPREDQNEPVVVQLEYDLQEASSERMTRLQGPKLPPDVYVERLYWELVLPSREHLLWGPDDLSSEMTWRRRLVFWGREPALTQSQLEQWTGAVEALPIPVDSNRYLFGGLTYRDELQFQSVSRSLLVLVGSGSCLVIGLMLIYVPAIRSLGLLYALALGVIALAIVYPEPGLMIAQAAGLGVVLVLVSAWLHYGYYRKRGRGAVVKAGGSVAERKSTDFFKPAAVSAETSTASASVALEEAESRV